MKSRISIQMTICERCGKSIATTNRSMIPSLAEMKKKFERVCSSCATEQEKHDILITIGAKMAEREDG